VDVRLVIPRVRRAIDGPTASSSAAVSSTLNDEAIKDLIADAISEVIWYAPEWGHGISVTDTDDDTGFPSEYDVTPDLSLPEQTVVVAQAALDYFWQVFRDMKVSERIANEAAQWEYTLSANLLAEQFKLLKANRDDALARILEDNPTLDVYASFLAVRDAEVAALIEPWTVEAGGVGGQQLDYRFG
jgi:hypothetical protein